MSNRIAMISRDQWLQLKRDLKGQERVLRRGNARATVGKNLWMAGHGRLVSVGNMGECPML